MESVIDLPTSCCSPGRNSDAPKIVNIDMTLGTAEGPVISALPLKYHGQRALILVLITTIVPYP